MQLHFRRSQDGAGYLFFACSVIILLLNLQMIGVCAQQVHVNIGGMKNPVDNDEELRQTLLSQAHKAARETSSGEDVQRLSREIKTLKQVVNPSLEELAKIKELEAERLLLLRHGMLQMQFQVPAEAVVTQQH